MKSLLVSLLLAVGLLSGCEQPAHAAKHPHFKELQNLQTLGEQARQAELPILLMFGAEWCEFCEQLNEEIFEPMGLNGLYEGKVMFMRHVGVDEQALIPGWNGQMIKKSNWAYALDADLTPTVLFVDGSGREVAPRIVGISEITLYAGLVHQNLNTAYKNMGLSKQIPITPELLYLESQALESPHTPK
ncbi:MAG: thioredoxin fold domain-containing protein [Gammaproteobacteria bacterium]|nr:thioredoxin fold domain-containing protein [Gammaproteobacteria bacterium]